MGDLCGMASQLLAAAEQLSPASKGFPSDRRGSRSQGSSYAVPPRRIAPRPMNVGYGHHRASRALPPSYAPNPRGYVPGAADYGARGEESYVSVDTRRSIPLVPPEQAHRILDSVRSNVPVEPVQLSAEAREATGLIEAASQRKLGEAPAVRRWMTNVDLRAPSTSLRCLHRGCEWHRRSGMDPLLLSRHLASHTANAAREQRAEDYLTSSVAEVLHELRLDVEVAPPLRKFTRRKFSRTLLGEQKRGLGRHAGVLETKIIGSLGNPQIRRCAYEMAFGECDGVGPSERIVRCDMCGTWSHVVCGGVALGGDVTEALRIPTATGHIEACDNRDLPAEKELGSAVLKEEHLCRGCARVTEPSTGSDPSPRIMQVLNDARAPREQMLRILEKDVAAGCPEGVFELNMRIGKGTSRKRSAKEAAVEGNASSAGSDDGEEANDLDGLGGESSDDEVFIRSVSRGDPGGEEEEGGDGGVGDGGDVEKTLEERAEEEERRARREKRAKRGSCSSGTARRRTRRKTVKSAVDDGVVAGVEPERPRCVAPSCGKASRPDSKYCSDRCGVLVAETTLSRALVHSLEEREGRERARRLREVRELKAHKHQIWKALKRAANPSVPQLSAAQSREVSSLVERKWRLWKRLIEIGAYWEKVSGSRNLLAITTSPAAAAEGAAIRQANAQAFQSYREEVASRQQASREKARGSVGSRSDGVGSAAAGSDSRRSAGDHDGLDKGKGSGGSGGNGDRGGDVSGAAPSYDAGVAPGGEQAKSSSSSSGADREVTATLQPVRPVQRTDAAVRARDDATGTAGDAAGASGVGVAVAGTAATSEAEGEAETEVDVGLEGSEEASELTPAPAAAVREDIGGSGHGGGGGEKKTDGRSGPRVGAESTETATGAHEGQAGAREVLDKPGGEKKAGGSTAADGAGVVTGSAACAGGGDGGKENPRSDRHDREASHGSESVAAAAAGAAPALSRSEQQQLRVWQQRQKQLQIQMHRQRQASLQNSKPRPKCAEELIQRHGVEELSCPYCGEPCGPRVAKHLEDCYRRKVAFRNSRLDHATLRPVPHDADGQGQGPPSGSGDGGVYKEAVGRQLLARRIPFAEFSSLPDPRFFQLHEDLVGWLESPSRLDLLYKELVRQRNSAMSDLQALDREEAVLERKMRMVWLKEGMRAQRGGFGGEMDMIGCPGASANGQGGGFGGGGSSTSIVDVSRRGEMNRDGYSAKGRGSGGSESIVVINDDEEERYSNGNTRSGGKIMVSGDADGGGGSGKVTAGHYVRGFTR